jgi:hypothetical protein
MRLIVTRDVFTSTTTLSILHVEYDGALAYTREGWVVRTPDNSGPLPFGFVVEDEDRGLNAAMPLAEIRKLKVKAETAIPTGEYVTRRTWSPKYGRLMPEVQRVPGYAGIRWHTGNSEADTAGCLVPGLLREGLRVLKSAAAFAWLDARMSECDTRGEAVRTLVRRDPAAWVNYRAG